MSQGRVLHVLKYYRPQISDEGLFLERSSAVMQELLPQVEHHLLVTNTPAPAEPSAICSTLRRVIYLSGQQTGPASRQAKLLWWFLRNLHRYHTIHYHAHTDRYFMTCLLGAIAGRRLVLSATPDDDEPGLIGDYRSSMRPLALRAFSLFDAVIGTSPAHLEQARQSGIRPARCHLVARDTTQPPGEPIGRQTAARYLGLYGLRARATAPEQPETGLGCGASITDPRFHAPSPVLGTSVPLLLTTVDAEEAFDWSGSFSRYASDVASMGSQHLAHRVFSRHGVKPLYLADYPVAAQDAGRAPLRELLQDGLCDVGAQMHPWVTPPFTEKVDEENSYAGNLPVELELEKARHLTDMLAEAFGEIPRIYRTGRYGVGPRTADVLKALGYQADSSLAPCWPTPDRRHLPSAWASSPTPYWADKERTLLEIPVSAALVGHLSRHGEKLAPLVFHRRQKLFPMAGAMSRLGLLERIRLTPEGMTIAEAKRLVRHMLAEGHRVFTLTYHSPSLEPGNTPYVRTIEQRDRFLDWLDEFYTFFRDEVGGRTASWRDVRFGIPQGGGAT